MFDLLSDRLQKSLAKVKAKLTLSEADLVAVTRDIKLALLEADVNLQVVKDFTKAVHDKALGAAIVGKLNAEQQVIKIVRDELVRVLGGKAQPLVLTGRPAVVMLVGLQGSGKTTTAAKLAKYLMKQGQYSKPLLIAADMQRPAAIEQLVTLGKELGISVFTQPLGTPALEVVKAGLAHAKSEQFDLVIIDTAGRLAIDAPLMAELVAMNALARPSAKLFVTDALAGQDIVNVAQTFHDQLQLTGAIITKLDSDARGGAALSLAYLLKIPLVFIGTGERVNALDLFHPDRMAERILGMGDVLSLIEQAANVVDEKQSQRAMRRMLSGEFNLNDLIDQLQQLKKLGKMSKVLKLIPGAMAKLDEAQLSSADRRLELFLILTSSMTKAEREQPRLLKEASRKARIIKGSGRTAQEYNQLINEFERMRKQMGELARQSKGGGRGPGRALF